MSKKTRKAEILNKKQIIQVSLSKLEQIEIKSFATVQNLIDYNQLDKATRVLHKLSTQIENSPEDFIETITHYLAQNNTNLIEKNEITTHKTMIKETKQFIKQIKKALKILNKNFNKTYLLIENDKQFNVITNAKLIMYLEELSQILNLTNNYKEAELAYDLKAKIELGFKRYFIHENVILKSFREDGTYEICNEIDKIQLEKYFETKPKINYNFKTNNFQDILIQLKNMKITNKKQYENEIKKYKKIFELFPKEIYTKEEYQNKTKISKSINPNFTENKLDLLKENKVLIEPYNETTINLTLKLLKDD